MTPALRWLALVPLLAACGGGGGAAAASMSDEDALKLGNGLSSRIAQAAYLSRELVVQAVYGATLQGGGYGTGKIIETGTLTQNLFGGFGYQAEPRDKLVLVLRQGGTHEFVIESVEGNTQAQTPAAWLDSNHRIVYRHRVPGTSEVDVEANRVGLGWACALDGWYVDQGERYQLKLKAQGGSYFEQGGRSGQESKTDYELSGTVQREGLKLTVDERHFFHLVSIGEAVTMSIDENRNTLKVGRTRYEWKDTQVTKIFRTVQGRMMPVFDAAEKWKAEGRVLKNGKRFGAYKLGVGGKSVDAQRRYHGTIDIVIALPDGKEVTLQSFRGS